ncbi:hypothetical protein C8R44DRAFT_892373 [Mycena epipterygia]|nr:hypothetical protein C8R44DRAFT_892373 [Mycena epipterygia]
MQPEDHAQGPGTSVPAPYADVFVADRFRLKRVVCVAGNFKKLCGTVTSTHPGEKIVDVRFEGRGSAPDAALKVMDVVEESTGWSLAQYVTSSQAAIKAQQDRIAALRTRKWEREKTPPGEETDKWVEVFGPAPRAPSPPFEASRALVIPDDVEYLPGLPYTELRFATGSWLRQPILEGKRLDVILRSKGLFRSGNYDDRVGTIGQLPHITNSGDCFTIEVHFGHWSAETVMKTKQKFLQPLHVTAYEGSNKTNFKGRPLLQAQEVGVIIIGADSTGSTELIGEYGWVIAGGNVRIKGRSVLFPLTSLCRSEGNPGILEGTHSDGRW